MARYRAALLCTVGVLSFSAAAVAFAQDSNAAQGGTVEHNETVQLEDIVVTAQKRNQNLQDVGIAITAFDGKKLDSLGIQQPSDLGRYTPNLNVKNVLNKSAPIFTIRGIGNAAFTSNSVAPVGVYVDELFLPTNSMMSFSVFDVERVEVLKGPQGTLFGRNTPGGAVSFITKHPVAGEADGYSQVGFGNYDTIDVEAAKTVSVDDHTAIRLASKWSRQGKGSFTNRINNTNDDIGRSDTLALRASLSTKLDGLDIYVNVHGGRENSENEPWVGIGRSALNNPTGPAPELPGVGGLQYRNACLSSATNSIQAFINDPNCVNRVGYHDPYTDPRVGEFSTTPTIKSNSFGGLAKIDVDLGDATLSSITAIEQMHKVTQEDFDGGPYRIGDSQYGNRINLFNQELRVTSSKPLFDRTNWILGAIYYNDSQHVTDLYGYRDRVNHDVLVDFVQKTRSIAGYVHTETKLTDRLSLIAGARLTNDRISFDGGTTVVNLDSDFTGAVTFFSVASPILINDQHISSTEVSGKVGLDFKVMDHVLAYASYSRGYKAGVWNGFWAVTVGDHSATKPEFIDAYEVGFKSTLFDRRLRLNGAVYDYVYSDMQLFADMPDGRYTIFNAGEANVKGAELEFGLLAGHGLEISGGVGYTDAKVSASVGLLDFTDARPANTPKFTGNIVAKYTHEVSENLSAYIQTDYAYQSSVYFSLDNLKAVSQDGYGLLGFRAGITSQDGWSLSAWVKNAENQDYFSEILSSGSAGLISGQIGSPRTYGASLRFDF
jgi:iron complex outermembrane receptor protein